MEGNACTCLVLLYVSVSRSRQLSYSVFNELLQPGDLKTRNSNSTSYQIEIHFFIETSTKFLTKYSLLQISDGLLRIFFTINMITKVSTSFIKGNKRYE